MLKLLFDLFKSQAVVDVVQQLFQSKVDNWRMEIYKKLSDVLASILLIIIISFIFLMMLLFLGFGLSFYLNIILESSYLGFVIVGCIFMIAAWLMSLSIRSGYFQHKLYMLILGILEKRSHHGNEDSHR